MKASNIFHKTIKGQAEIEAKTNALSMKERRVLILVNGQNNAGKLRELSLCDNVAEILDTLTTQGFIEPDGESGEAVPGSETVPGSKIDNEAKTEDTVTEFEVGAREFMVNTLLTFANRVRVAKLVEEINAVADIDSLKNLVKPWYQAISETPGGMYQADDLRKEVQDMIENEQVGGIK